MPDNVTLKSASVQLFNMGITEVREEETETERSEKVLPWKILPQYTGAGKARVGAFAPLFVVVAVCMCRAAA
jgi:hypothetical protein